MAPTYRKSATSTTLPRAHDPVEICSMSRTVRVPVECHRATQILRLRARRPLRRLTERLGVGGAHAMALPCRLSILVEARFCGRARVRQLHGGTTIDAEACLSWRGRA